MRRSLSLAIAVGVAFQAVVAAQSPHGASNAKPQPGANVNAAGGIVADPNDPAALVKTDILRQRQNETVVAASTRNPDHILAAANDYRFVDFPQDAFVMEQSFLTRLLAKLTFRPAPSRPPARATIGVGAWTGVYRSCDRAGTFIGSAVPGSPLDNSPASLASPLKAFSNYAASVGGHAETTDPALVAGPNGQMHLFVLGFIRKLDGSVTDGRMYHVSYTDRNNREGGACFHYDYAVEFDVSAAYKSNRFPAPFLDKPSAAIDKDGTLYVAYTVFDDADNSRIVVARSTNGGISWTKTMPLLSAGFLRNHGATMAVDPLNGDVFVAWRVFYQNWPLMVISRSPNNGRTFLPATPISHLWPTRNLDQIVQQLKGARLQPFDQFNNAPNTPATARALAFPSLAAGVVNGKTRLFAVWTERADVNPQSSTFGQPLATGSPRVMVSASDNGSSWTPRRALDAGPRTENLLQPGVGPIATRPSGPQVQPAINISGMVNAQVTVAYYEARDELVGPPFDASFISGIERQMDVRIARLDPVTLNLLAPSVQVSQYAVQANTSTARLVETAPGFPAVNRENLYMYGGGFKAFFGDFMSLASSTTLVTGSPWTWSPEPSSVFAIWTDHRDAGFPFDAVLQQPSIYGRWDLYTPLISTLLAGKPADCSNTAMRDANPYVTEIAGVIAGAPQTFKPLTIQRAFATYVGNQTPVDRFFRLRVLDNEAVGLDGSFNQFSFTEADDTLDVKVFGNSRHNQTVWVQPLLSNPTAKLKITVEEIDRINGSVKANGLRTSIVLNPDPNNDALTRVPAAKPPFDTDLSDNTEIHDPSVSAPRVSTFRMHYPGVSTPQIDTPQIDTHPATPQIDTPQIDTPQIDTRGIAAPQIDTHLATPQIDTPQIDTPQIDTVAPDNGTDYTVTVTNSGTTNTVYKTAFNVQNVDALINSGNYQFLVILSKVTLTMSGQQTAAGCVPAAQPHVQVLASIPVPSTQVAQLGAIKNPQIDTVSVPDIVTFTLAPFGGVAGQNTGSNDVHSTVLPDEIKVTLRAIRLRSLAEIAATNGPVFDPGGVVVRVESKSTNVIAGVPGAPGTQPVVLGSVAGAFLGEPFAGVPNRPMQPVVRVRARDLTGAPLPGVPVNLALSTNPTSAVLSGNAAVTNESGIAQFPALEIDRVGLGYVLEATSGDTVLEHSAPFTILEACLANGLTVSNVYEVESFDVVSNPIVTRAGAKFDDDSYPDVAVLHGNGLLTRMRNNGAGAPRRSFQFVPGPGFTTPTDMALGDFNEDGLTDVAISYLATNNVAISLSAFPSPFTVPTAVPIGVPANAIAVADFNGDLHLDLAVVSTSANSVSFLFGTGTGTFGPPETHGTGGGSLPSSIAVGDLNEDGRADAAVATSDSGALAVFLGVVSGPMTPLGPYSMPGSLQAITLRDLNADGHLDVALADTTLPDEAVVAFGDGHGAFGAPAYYPIGGTPTSITAGDYNGDGRIDIAVAVPSLDETRILFNNAGGGFSAPAFIPSSTEPVHVTTADLNGDGRSELIVTNRSHVGICCDNIVVIQGSCGAITANTGVTVGGPGAPVATGSSFQYVTLVTNAGPFPATNVTLQQSTTTGTWTAVTPSAGICSGMAPTSCALGTIPPGGTVTVTIDITAGSNPISTTALVTSSEVDLVPANNSGFRSTDIITPATYVVTSAADSGTGTLRQAILNANANAPALDTILFSIPAPWTIALTSNLPAITDPININGTTLPLYAEGARVQVAGGGLAGAGFHVTAAGAGSTIRGLSITGWAAHAIRLTGGGNTIAGNYIGLTPGGVSAPNGEGVWIDSSPGNKIGGAAVDGSERNVISGNAGHGVLISGGTGVTGNKVLGNYIGTNRFGNGGVANGGSGVHVGAPTAVGGTLPGEGNVISGNGQHGVEVTGGGFLSTIRGNMIGTDKDGTLDIGNVQDGVLLTGAVNVEIGGTDAGSKNVISGNDEYGVVIDADSFFNNVAGNIIGTNKDGTLELHNGHNDPLFVGDLTGAGVRVDGPSNNIGVVTILGGVGNLISGNNIGISIRPAAGGNIIQANRIGLNAAGGAAIRNRKFGIFVAATGSTTIGGTSALARNVISGNTLEGVVVSGTGVSALIRKNYIGTNVGGTAAVGNGQEGVQAQLGATITLLENVISGNSNTGVRLETDGNFVTSNLIGTKADGTSALGNGGLGISIVGGTNAIGGSTFAERNIIAFNTAGGVSISGGVANDITENSIYGNGGPGIDLGGDGITANDPLDADPGANNLQNFPVLTSAVTSGAVTGTLSSSASTTFVVRFYVTPSCGTDREGKAMHLSAVLTTDAAGDRPFVVFMPPMTAGEGVTATATDASGNTSEFSACQAVVTGLEPEQEPITSPPSAAARHQPPADRAGRLSPAS